MCSSHVGSLVEWPSVQQLNNGCNSLFKMLHEVSRAWASWGSSPGVVQVPEWKADLKAAHDICEEATKTLRVVSTMDCLHTQTGKDRLDLAGRILAKRKGLPLNLVAALEKLR